MEPSVWNYPIMIGTKYDGKRDYYLAWCPDFGLSACSATGDTPEEALKLLQVVFADVHRYYVNTGRKIPSPNWPEAFLAS